jgi:predicted methyltransferase
MKLRRYVVVPAVSLIAALIAGCAGMPAAAPDYRAIVAAPDRTDADRASDARRKPEQLLAFAGVRPGMKVLDLGAGGGYSTELLARAAGPQGIVYGQDTKAPSEQARTRFDQRMKIPAMKNTVRVLRDYDDPVPPEARELDLVTIFFGYHDLPGMGVDRASMNRRIFQSLKSGGLYVITDHAAKAGVGVSASKSLHRIEESVLRREVEAAGFRFVADADFLRNPGDPREERVFGLKIPVDNFALKFVKP